MDEEKRCRLAEEGRFTNSEGVNFSNKIIHTSTKNNKRTHRKQ